MAKAGPGDFLFRENLVLFADLMGILAPIRQDLTYQNKWSWFLKPRAQAKEKKLLENFHAVSHALLSIPLPHHPPPTSLTSKDKHRRRSKEGQWRGSGELQQAACAQAAVPRCLAPPAARRRDLHAGPLLLFQEFSMFPAASLVAYGPHCATPPSAAAATTVKIRSYNLTFGSALQAGFPLPKGFQGK